MKYVINIAYFNTVTCVHYEILKNIDALVLQGNIYNFLTQTSTEQDLLINYR